jgi:hypothetical protein
VTALGVRKDSGTLSRLRLPPLRDLQAVLVWAASLVVRTVVWRGDFFTLKHGRLDGGRTLSS